MDSRNSNKQQELKKRLEEIRQQRAAAEASGDDRNLQRTLDDVYKDVTRTTRRNVGQQSQRPSRQSRRDAEQPRNTQQRRSQQQRDNAQQRRNAPMEQSTHAATSYEQQAKERKLDEYFSREETASPEVVKVQKASTLRNDKKTNISSKSLLNQLSSGENIAQAIILNEILSKPIALRKR